MANPERDRARSSPDGPPGAPPSQGRRRFLAWVTVGLGGVASLIAGLPAIGFLFSPARRREPDVWRPVGALEEFPIGATRKVDLLDPAPVPWAGFAALSAAWLRREGEEEFIAFSLYCTHTGCPVQWEEGAELFMCLCHGGAFYRDGSVASGPPPTPLERHPVRVRNGLVEVQTIGLPTP